MRAGLTFDHQWHGHFDGESEACLAVSQLNDGATQLPRQISDATATPSSKTVAPIQLATESIHLLLTCWQLQEPDALGTRASCTPGSGADMHRRGGIDLLGGACRIPRARAARSSRGPLSYHQLILLIPLLTILLTIGLDLPKVLRTAPPTFCAQSSYF